MKTPGERILDSIIEGILVRAECVDDKEHVILFTWSANVIEQLDALVEEIIKERTQHDPRKIQ